MEIEGTTTTSSHREVVEGVGVNHAVEIAHLFIGVGEDRVIHRGVLGLVDVADPALVAFGAVNAQGDGFDVALLPFRAQAGHLAELGGADGRVVGGVREEHHPAIGPEVVEIDGAELGILGEIGNGVAELQCHGGGE